MSGTLVVQNLQGPASGANANKIIVPAGQVLDASAGFVAPAGSVIQTMCAGVKPSSAAHVSFSITPTGAILHGASYGNRTYNIAQTVNITKKNSNSYFVCWGTVGFSSYTSASTGAHGASIILDGTSMIDCGDFPYYDEALWANVDSMYKPPMSLHGVLTTPTGISSHVITLRPFGYIETGSAAISYNGSSLIVQEIAG